MNFNLVWIITVFLLIFFTLQGWKKGILGIVFGCVSWILIFVFVAFSHPYIEDFLRDNTKVYDIIYEETQEQLEKKSQKDKVDNKKTPTLEKWWDSVTKGLPAQTIRKIEDDLTPDFLSTQTDNVSVVQDTQQELQEILAVKIADFILQGVAVFIALIIGSLAAGLIEGIVKAVGKVPVIHGVNGALGLVAGMVEGLLIIWMLLYLVACISGTALGQNITADIEESSFLTYLYHHNLLMIMISSL